MGVVNRGPWPIEIFICSARLIKLEYLSYFQLFCGIFPDSSDGRSMPVKLPKPNFLAVSHIAFAPIFFAILYIYVLHECMHA